MKVLMIMALATLLTACGAGELMKNNLVYASGRDVGFVTKTSPQDGGIEMVFGMSSGNFVSAPLVSDIGEGGLISGTECVQILAANGELAEICNEDAVSTLSFFGAKKNADTVCIGEMASTGLAARMVAASLANLCGQAPVAPANEASP